MTPSERGLARPRRSGPRTAPGLLPGRRRLVSLARRAVPPGSRLLITAGARHKPLRPTHSWVDWGRLDPVRGGSLSQSRSSRTGHRRRCPCSSSWLQPPRDGCEAFHDLEAHRRAAPAVVMADHGRAPPRSRPVAAGPVLAGRNAVPSGCEPVRMSCRFGVSPRPLTTSPFSVSAVSLVEVVVAVQLVDVLRDHLALALCQGPPDAVRALTAGSPPSPAC